MTRKESILRMIEKLDDDVSLDQVVYHLEFMRTVEARLEEAEHGQWVAHDEFFASLRGDNEKGKDRVASERKNRSGANSKRNSQTSTANRGSVRKTTGKRHKKAS